MFKLSARATLPKERSLKVIAGVAAFVAGTIAIQSSSVAQDAEALAPVTFTEEQATLGRSVAANNCTSCHGSRLTGGGGPEGGPTLVGDRFAGRWFEASVSSLFLYISSTMPADNRGTLEPDEVARVLAYILSLNEFMPGEEPLANTAEALELVGFNQPEAAPTP